MPCPWGRGVEADRDDDRAEAHVAGPGPARTVSLQDGAVPREGCCSGAVIRHLSARAPARPPSAPAQGWAHLHTGVGAGRGKPGDGAAVRGGCKRRSPGRTGRPVRQRPGLRSKAVPVVWASSGPNSVHVAAKRCCRGHGDRQEGVRSGQGAVEGGAADDPPGADSGRGRGPLRPPRRVERVRENVMRRAPAPGSGEQSTEAEPTPELSRAAGRLPARRRVVRGEVPSYRRSHRAECATGACAGADAAPGRPGLRAGRGTRAGEPARAPVLPPHASARGSVRMP